MTRLPLLYNPRSGASPKDPEALLARLPALHRARVEPLAFGPPWNFDEAIARAKAASGPLLVWGGDGTIHHAARALVAAGCPVPLGAVPGGSGNGLVRGLRTPLDPAGAVARLLEGRELRMDLPRLDGVPFLNVAGTGFEATLAHAFEGLGTRGFLAYARLSLRLWRKEGPLALRWEAEQPGPEGPEGRLARIRSAWRGAEPGLPDAAWSLAFANLPQYGSGLWIAPGADPTDGVLQWATLARPTALDLVAELPQLFREGGRTPLRREGRLLRATLRLERPAGFHLDGEPVPARDRAELSLEPRAFRMQVTEGCPWS